MGTTLPELTANIPKDPTLASVVQSTCQMVRDYSVKQLIMINAKSAISLKDICYGTGFVMHEGTMVNTGGCALKSNNGKGSEEVPLNVGDGSNSIYNTCELKEGDI
jgi:hypothetical protein